MSDENEKNNKTQSYDSLFQNVKFLMRHYRTLNTHYLYADLDTDNVETQNNTQANGNENYCYVDSIIQSCIKTKFIMAHVNKMLGIYEIMCNESDNNENKRRWRVLKNLYLSDSNLSAEQIATLESIDKRTVYKDIDACITDLTALIFGIDGIKF